MVSIRRAGCGATIGAAFFIARLPAQPEAPTFTPGRGWGGAEAAAAPAPLPGLSSDGKLAGAGVRRPRLGRPDAVTEGHSSRRRRLRRKHGRVSPAQGEGSVRGRRGGWVLLGGRLTSIVLGWPKRLLGFFRSILRKNSNEFRG